MLFVVDDTARPERVVHDDQPAVGEQRQGRLVVVDVVRLVGVDEDEVEGAVQLRDRLQARAEPVLDAISDACLLCVAPCDRSRLLVDVAADDPAAERECKGHRDRRVTGEGPQLEHALRTQATDEHSEEAALETADHHLRRGRLLAGLRRQTVEQLAVRRRVLLGVRLDARVDYEAHSTRPRRTQPL